MRATAAVPLLFDLSVGSLPFATPASARPFPVRLLRVRAVTVGLSSAASPPLALREIGEVPRW